MAPQLTRLRVPGGESCVPRRAPAVIQETVSRAAADASTMTEQSSWSGAGYGSSPKKPVTHPKSILIFLTQQLHRAQHLP